MRKILSLLLILALFLPCALAETPQGIDLALTSTYGDGLSLRMTAGLGETPFCSLTLPSGQINLAFSPDKGLASRAGPMSPGWSTCACGRCATLPTATTAAWTTGLLAVARAW